MSIPKTVIEIVPAHILQLLDAAGFEVRQKPNKKALGGYTEEFEREVWGPYPRKKTTSKMNGFKRFLGLSEADKALLKASIPVYAKQRAGHEESFTCHLEFFITRRMFETIIAPALRRDIQPPRQDWSEAMRRYRVTNDWPQELGPPPGRPGCRVPPQFLS